jgi:hypothetical protein
MPSDECEHFDACAHAHHTNISADMLFFQDMCGEDAPLQFTLPNLLASPGALALITSAPRADKCALTRATSTHTASRKAEGQGPRAWTCIRCVVLYLRSIEKLSRIARFGNLSAPTDEERKQ